MIRNLSKKTEISPDFMICKGILCKMIGLMFSFKPKTIVFDFRKEQKMGLHMLFVFFPIDLLFIDDKMKIVELKERFLPFTFYNSKAKAKYVVELPSSSIRKSKTSVGDLVMFKK